MTIIFWAIGWLIGIGLGSYLAWPAPAWLALAIAVVAAAVLLRRQLRFPALFLVMTAAALGAARYEQSRTVIDQGHVAYFNGSEAVVVSGLVVQPPDIGESYQNLVLEAETISSDAALRAVKGQVMLRAARWPIITYGTRIEASGLLEEPENFGTFDYHSYLARRDIHSVMYWPEIVALSSQAGSPIMHRLLAVRGRAQRAINQILPQPQAALLSGILLGDDHALPKDLEEDFRASGMSHIIAISGFNIALIAGVLVNGGRHVVGRRAAAWMAIAGVAAYAVLVGAEASVVRAAVMAVLFIIAASLLGRPTFAPAALLAAAFFMSFLNPDILWDVGFQLSFMATLGLMLYVGMWRSEISRALQPKLGDALEPTVTRLTTDVVLSTAAAFILTFPLLIYHFDTLSVVSPLANLLILPAQPGIMTWGGLATLTGMISPSLGQAPAWIAWLFLTYTIKLVAFFGSLPFATMSMSISLLGLLGLYGLVFAVSWVLRAGSSDDEEDDEEGFRLNGRIQKLLLVTLMLMAALLLAWLWWRPDGRMHVAFLDVGQGDAILIQTPEGKQVLVDGGAQPSLLLSRIGEEMPFWDKEIELVVATHPDSDHTGGLVDIFENYRVGQVITNGADGEAGSNYRAFLQDAQHAQTPIHAGISGEVVAVEPDVSIKILHAAATPGSGGDNDESLVMRLAYKDFSVLLAGDAELAVEQSLLQNKFDLQATILKAGHHGSQTSSSRRFLNSVNPQIVVISAGRNNGYGHPHAETIERISETGAMILRTDELGTIELISDGRLVWSDMGYGVR